MSTPKNIDGIAYLFPAVAGVEGLLKQRPDAPFSEATVEFLNALYQELGRDRNVRNYPDVATFAFFCRRASLLKQKQLRTADDRNRIGRGVVFHIAPSNVPVNFAYSMVCGLLAGNSNVVRVPTRHFAQVELIRDAIARVSQAEEHRAVGERIALVRYDRKSLATAFFSDLCDVRIIWGGDASIQEIRKTSLPPRSRDITFADRFSICLIKAEPYLSDLHPERIAEAFYNDTYLFDQNACTAPHLVVWLGENESVESAKKRFWMHLHKVVKARYGNLEAIVAVDKLALFYTQAARIEGVLKGGGADNVVWRAELANLPKDIECYRCSCGYFSEYHAKSLTELSRIVSRKYQTVAYYGLERSDLRSFVLEARLLGVDRIVPLGRTMEFSLIWDGYDLISELSRCLVVT